MRTALRHFTVEQREQLQQALERHAARLREEIDEDRKADLNAEPESAALARDVRELPEVEAALLRLHQPDFGRCVDCGEDIPFSRLHATPWSTRCLRCQQKHEGA